MACAERSGSAFLPLSEGVGRTRTVLGDLGKRTVPGRLREALFGNYGLSFGADLSIGVLGDDHCDCCRCCHR